MAASHGCVFVLPCTLEGENALIAHPIDPTLGHCPLCGRPASRAQVIIECPALTPTRNGITFDLHLRVHRFPPGPLCTLALAIFQLLMTRRPWTERASLWTRLWQHRRRTLATARTTHQYLAPLPSLSAPILPGGLWTPCCYLQPPDTSPEASPTPA